MNEIITAENIKKTFIQGNNTIDVLKGINLTLVKDEILTIVGPSGAGKSSLLYILGLLSEPTEGDVVFKYNKIVWSDEKKLTSLRNNSIGFIFQFHYLLPDFTAIENVMLPAFVKGENKSSVITRATSLLESVGLGDRIDHRPGELSGGEQQRVAIARALINNPDLILADEPTGDLDAVQAKIVWEILHNLARGKKATLVIVTHNEELAKSSDRILCLHDGKIIKS